MPTNDPNEHKRFRSGAWALTINAKDPVTGERKPVDQTVHAPNTKRGAEKADTELAKLVAEVEMGRTMPTSGLTVEQLVERYIVDESPGWSPGAGDETRRRVAQHITPHIGVEQLHAVLRAGRAQRGHDRARARRAQGGTQVGGAARPHREQPSCRDHPLDAGAWQVPGGTVEKETKTGARWPIVLDAVTVELLRAHRRRCAGC